MTDVIFISKEGYKFYIDIKDACKFGEIENLRGYICENRTPIFLNFSKKVVKLLFQMLDIPASRVDIYSVPSNILLESISLAEELSLKQPYLYRVTEVVRGIIRGNLNARPMINDVNEIGTLLNLILPSDKQFPKDLNRVTIDQLSKLFQAKVSFVRPTVTDATQEDEDNSE